MGKDMAFRGTAGSAGVQRAVVESLQDEAGGQAAVSSASAC